MRNLMCAAIALAAVASTAPAMAQAGPSAYEPPVAVQVPPLANGHWQLLQGYGKDGEVTYTWYYVTAPDFSRYHGS